MMLPEHSWLYEDLESRVCVGVDEILFLSEEDGFLFDTASLARHFDEIRHSTTIRSGSWLTAANRSRSRPMSVGWEIDLETLKFSRLINEAEEEYHPRKDKEVIVGSPIYYPDDNCFIVYFNRGITNDHLT